MKICRNCKARETKKTAFFKIQFDAKEPNGYRIYHGAYCPKCTTKQIAKIRKMHKINYIKIVSTDEDYSRT